MANCKDCIHYEPCFEYGNILDPIHGGVKCDSFKPAADVVPKSEVERLNKKIDALKRDRYQVFPDGRLELLPRTDLYKIKAEVAREIFEEIDRIIDEKYNRFVFKDQPYDSDEEIDAIINYSDSVSDAITGLKKKYEGGEFEGEQNS